MKHLPINIEYIDRIILLLTFSILFANPLFAIIMLMQVLIIVAGTVLKQPAEIIIKRQNTKNVLLPQNVLKNVIDIEIGSGIGKVVIVDNLPSNFELVEGNNFKILWKGFREKKAQLTYTIKCSASGVYTLDNISWETMDVLNLRAPFSGTSNEEQTIEVRPRTLDVRKIRNTGTRSKIPLPEGSMSRMGIPTMDFRELRLYSHGDSFRYINWKATSRNVYKGGFWPVVNEYEKEGKKVVWIFLDMSDAMEYGTNIKNALNYGLEAVNGLADYYLKENSMVAFTTYNGSSLLVHPGIGKKQYYEILKTLMELGTIKKQDVSKDKAGAVHLTLKETVIKNRGYFAGSRPLAIFVTRITKESTPSLSSGIMEMSKYTGVVQGHLPVIVINIAGYNLTNLTKSGEMSAALLKTRDDYVTDKIKRGITWVEWNPAKDSFTSTLIKQVVKQ